MGTVPEDLACIRVVKVPFAINLSAGAKDLPDGFNKIWLNKNRVVAAYAIGHNVSEIMQEFANMIALKTCIEVVSEIIQAHPAYAEIIRSMLDHALGKALDLVI